MASLVRVSLGGSDEGHAAWRGAPRSSDRASEPLIATPIALPAIIENPAWAERADVAVAAAALRRAVDKHSHPRMRLRAAAKALLDAAQ